MPMNYYYIFLNECGDFDDETIYLRPGVKNIGLILDWWPPDDLFQSSSEIFCTERLKSLLETDYQKFTGISGFQEVERITTGANWEDRHAEARPGYYWRLNINGKALSDDFGYFITTAKRLVLSARALKFLMHNHVTEALGQKIEGDIEIFFKDYEIKQKQNNFSFLPPKLLNIDRLFS